ncbi:hypothetical protein ScPMuIL_014205 [Solemya velum]
MVLRIFSLCLLFLVDYVNGHGRFVCPRPISPTEQDPDNENSFNSCSGNITQTRRKYQDIVPGPFTLRWEEFVYHKDSPFRISLHDHDNVNYTCVLLDQIPHNNDARVAQICKVLSRLAKLQSSTGEN